VTVAELLSNPSQYVGRSVRLEGDVVGMCHHRRAWFALRDPGATDQQYLRVVTAPAFLVPQGSMGSRATAEGKVDAVDVPAAMAKHYAADHKLGNADEVQGPVKQYILRATGAEFI
jgi:hypothetical protein